MGSNGEKGKALICSFFHVNRFFYGSSFQKLCRTFLAHENLIHDNTFSVLVGLLPYASFLYFYFFWGSFVQLPALPLGLRTHHC